MKSNEELHSLNVFFSFASFQHKKGKSWSSWYSFHNPIRQPAITAKENSWVNEIIMSWAWQHWNVFDRTICWYNNWMKHQNNPWRVSRHLLHVYRRHKQLTLILIHWDLKEIPFVSYWQKLLCDILNKRPTSCCWSFSHVVVAMSFQVEITASFMIFLQA